MEQEILEELSSDFTKEISDITGLGKSTITKYLKGEEIKEDYYDRILEALEIYLIEHQERSKRITQIVKQLIKEI